MADITVRNVSHAFGDVRVLEDVSFSIANGDFVAVIGPSGCGKSTLLKMLSGLVLPTSGTVTISDKDVAGRPGSAAYMPQSDLLLPWRRALANAMVGTEVAGRTTPETRNHALGLFERFGLRGFERAWPHELSGGMRQRVAVLRTFLLPQQALLLDEPFGALDALTRMEMQHWLEDVWFNDQRTTVLVTHDVEEALLLSDRVLVLSGRPGRIELDIDVDLQRPRNTEVATSSAFVSMKQQILDCLIKIR